MSDTVVKLPWHAAQWQRLGEARASGRLPHAVLLSGPAGVGKSQFARRLGQALVCPTPDDAGDACGVCKACHQAVAGSHPDLHRVAPEEPGKPIKIDAIRALTAKSVLSAEQGGHRVITIDPADAMNRAAANALLKTLEEPGSRTVLVLVSSHGDRLPATIRSRCQAVSFPIPPAAQARDWLAAQGCSAELDALLALSGGAPLRAVQADEQAWLGTDASLIAELGTLKHRESNPLKVVEEWQNRPLHLVFEGLKRCVADLVRLAGNPGIVAVYHPGARSDLQSLGQGIDLRKLFLFNDELLQLERDSINNLNPQMMLEHLANRWLQLTRPGGR